MVMVVISFSLNLGRQCFEAFGANQSATTKLIGRASLQNISQEMAQS